MNRKQKRNLYRIIITAILLVLIELFEIDNNLYDLLYLIPYIIISYDIVRKAFKSIINREPFDENFLMVVATIGSAFMGEYEESVMVMLLYQIGELFQSYAVGKSRKNIASLMNIRPDYANVFINGEYIKINPSELKVGDIFLVKVGEKIPVDGVVTKGDTSLNTSALTGESKPKDVKENDEVISGCINMSSPIEVKATKIYDESTVSKVLYLVENATSNKSKSEDFISKFARYYTPIVCYCSLSLAIIPPLFIKIFSGIWQFETWINRALTFLVISCPCALVISIPLTFFACIGGASKSGILIKGSNYVEQLSKVKYVAFDKTGTITLGIFEVTTIHNNKMDEKTLLEYAAYAEFYSNHPIAKSIIKEYNKPIDNKRIVSIKEINGQGIKAVIDDKNILVGNELLMDNNHIAVVPCKDEGTIVHIAIDNEYKGHIHIGDQIKPTSKKTINELQKMGIKKIAMLTGDDVKTANAYGKELNIQNTYANLLPQDKVEIINKLIKDKKADEVLTFVGDGINDAPVIALADVGIAMGALGSDAAIEAADVVLMDDDPLKIVKAIKLAKKGMRIVNENIYFSIGVKVLCLILSAFGITNMWLAIFADTGVMIIAVLNAVRALRIKR